MIPTPAHPCTLAAGSVVKFDFGVTPNNGTFAECPSLGFFGGNKSVVFCLESKLRRGTGWDGLSLLTEKWHQAVAWR